MPPFMTKNAKRKMKARINKKKMNLVNCENGELHESTTASVAPKSASKDIAPDSNWKQIASKIKCAVIQIPTGLSAKEAKKFRKDKRRDARVKGESEPKFVTNDSLLKNSDCKHKDNDSTVGSKRKRYHGNSSSSSVPNINDLVEEERRIAKENAAKARKKEEEDNVSPDERAKYVALDCEMVGIGEDSKTSALARVSITDWDGNIVVDKFVKVPDRVTDFRTWVSGVRAKDIKSDDAITPQECRNLVGKLLIGKILVGHSLKNDLSALLLTHPRHEMRDTASYAPYMKPRGKNGGKLRPRKLRDLAKEKLNIDIQVDGEAHSSIDDARTAMELYKIERIAWEKSISSSRRKNGLSKLK